MNAHVIDFYELVIISLFPNRFNYLNKIGT